MIRLIFSGSLAATPVAHQLSAFLEDSRERYRRHGISGLMVLMERDFLQVMEGRTTAVDRHFDRLSAQSRRFNLLLLARQKIDRPLFSDWRLGRIQLPLPSTDGVPQQSPILLDIQHLAPRNDDERHTLQVINDFVDGKWRRTSTIDANRPYAVLHKRS